MNIKTYRIKNFEVHTYIEELDTVTGLIHKQYFLKDSTLVKEEIYDKQKLEQVYYYRKNGSLKIYERRRYILEANPPKTRWPYYPCTKTQTITDYYGKNGKTYFLKDCLE